MSSSQEPPRRSAFYEQVARDFTDVFLNVEEFGRVVKWNGRDLLIAEGAAPPLLDSDFNEGVYAQSKEIYCRQMDLPRAPKVTEEVLLDGVYWHVVDVKSPFGHYIITLGRRSS